MGITATKTHQTGEINQKVDSGDKMMYILTKNIHK